MQQYYTDICSLQKIENFPFLLSEIYIKYPNVAWQINYIHYFYDAAYIALLSRLYI